MSKGKWALIEELDEFEIVVALHVMPVKEIQNVFPTKEEAYAFVAQMERDGNPWIMDGDGETALSYYGHKLGKDCQCRPELGDGLNPTYVHRHNS